MTKGQIKLRIKRQLSKLVIVMCEDYGRDSTYWADVILKSRLYGDILNVKTHLFSEGVRYLQDMLTDELGLPSVE
jgi:hypothetical protein